MATTNTEKGKARGNGPLAITFIDGSNKAHKRVPADVTSVEVSDRKSGKVRRYELEKVVGDNMVWPLVAIALGKRLETYIRNTVKNNEGANVIDCAESVIVNIKSGKIYTRAEGNGGGAQGRPFDYDFWKEVMANAAGLKGKKLSDKQLDGFVAGLKALSGKDRHKETLTLQKDAAVKAAFKKLQAKRAEAALKKGGAEGDYDAFANL